MEDEREGKSRYHRGEEGNLPAPGGRLSQAKLSLETSGEAGSEDSRPAQKATLHFKTDRRPFRLTRCWQAKFFHRDDMRLPVNTISAALDFTIRPGDSTSVQRYKRFLGDVHLRFGTLDPNRMVRAIRDENGRKKLRACYHHIRGNHNDVSLVFWHGPIPMRALARLNAGQRTRGRKEAFSLRGCNGGTLLTGDLTCTDRVVQKMERHFGSRLPGSAFLQVPHHGSVHSWNSRLIAATSPEIIPVISAGRSNGYRHPHPQVIDALENTNGRMSWFLSDERNTLAMHVETI